VTQKKYNSDNCIVLMIINIFIVSMVIGGPASGVANPKLWRQMFDFRKTSALFLGRFSMQKMTRYSMLKFGARGHLSHPGYAYGSCTACFS